MNDGLLNIIIIIKEIKMGKKEKKDGVEKKDYRMFWMSMMTYEMFNCASFVSLFFFILFFENHFV